MLGDNIDSEYAVTSLNDVTESNEVKLQEKNQENVSVTHIENYRRKFSEFPFTFQIDIFPFYTVFVSMALHQAVPATKQ